MTTICEILAPLAEWSEPRTVAGNPFRLDCHLEKVTEPEELRNSLGDTPLPSGVAEFWGTWRTAILFFDVDCGQWGLKLLSPTDSAARTAQERIQRPNEFQPLDIVLGEFLGDQELLVIDNSGAVLIALPLDERGEWHHAAGSFSQFLSRYVAQGGMKYWERES